MKGYEAETGKFTGKDIYDDVAEFLIKDIQDIKDQNTTIIVCPYQASNGVLAAWREENADDVSKSRIIKKIENYRNDDITYTDIVGAIEYAKLNLIDLNSFNRLVILTDGTHNTGDKANDSKIFDDAIKDWKLYAPSHNSYALYVTVGQNADIPESVREDETGTIIVVDVDEPGKTISLIDLCPQNVRMCINDLKGKSDTTLVCYFTQNSVAQLGTEEPMVNIELVDTYGLLKETSYSLPLRNNRILIPLEFRKTSEEMHAMLPVDTDTLIQINYLPIEFGNPNYKIVLQKNTAFLTLVNKPEPKLTIRFK